MNARLRGEDGGFNRRSRDEEEEEEYSSIDGSCSSCSTDCEHIIIAAHHDV
jgi:hypothetical protein